MRKAQLLLRIGLAFVFLYASVAGFITPNDWLWYIPDWVQKIAPALLLLRAHGLSEFILGIWLLVGWKGIFPAVFAALDLLVITLLNINIFGIVFRDIGLFFAALALVFLYKDQKTR
jgi:hypothetical protein